MSITLQTTQSYDNSSSIDYSEKFTFSATPDLIEKISSLNLGLRHVTGIEKALQETVNGFNQGCSLNLNSLKSTLITPNPNVSQKLLSPAGFDRKVKSFIYKSLVFDLCNSNQLELINPGQTLLKNLAKVVEIAQFCLVNYSNTYQTPTDFDMWGYGLGRYPKSNIDASKIHYFKPLKLKDLNFSEQELNEPIKSTKHYEECIEKIVNRIYTQFLENANHFFN